MASTILPNLDEDKKGDEIEHPKVFPPAPVDEKVFQTVPDEEKKELLKKQKPYFNQYVVYMIQNKPGAQAEQIQLDMFYHCLLLRSNMLAKEVYLFRKQDEEEKAEFIYRNLVDLRQFWCRHYGVPYPEPNEIDLFQNELTDDLKILDNLPAEPAELLKKE
jgi:hypothetical protein